MKKIVLTILVVVVASSCSIYQKYTRPAEVSTENIYGNIVSQDTTSLSDISWRNFFTDKYLQGYIEQGLKNNADLKIAVERIGQSQASLRAAKLAFAPSFGFSPSFSAKTCSYSYSVPITASWEIDILGRQLNRKRSAEVALEQSKLYHRSVQTALIAEIANTYYTILMIDAQMRVSRATAASWKENVRTMKAMKEAGMTNEASISQTEANSCSIDASVFDLEYNLIKAENALAILLGTTPQHFERGELNGVDFKGELFIGVPMQLLSRRPDVQQAEHELMLAFYNTNIARADLYPSLTISGEGGWEQIITNPGGFFFSFAAKLFQPIFQGGKLRANLKIAESRQREALINFQQKLLEAGNEVNTAVARCRTARSKTNIRIKQVAVLESAVYSTRQLMSHSEATYLEVLTAQQSQLSARLQQIADRFEGIQGMINLYRALGGGAEEPVLPEPAKKCKKCSPKKDKK